MEKNIYQAQPAAGTYDEQKFEHEQHYGFGNDSFQIIIYGTYYD